MGALALVCAACLCVAARTTPQQEPATRAEDTAPPPMKFLPAEIRAQLSAEHDIKARTRLSLELAEQHLARAATETTAESYEQAERTLGVYRAIVENSIQTLQASGKVTNKTRDLFKRVEVSLRMHIPRLETIRRTTPSAYAVYVKETLDFVRRSRTDSLNAFYDDTVLPDQPSKQKDKSAGEHAKDNTPDATQEQKPPRF